MEFGYWFYMLQSFSGTLKSTKGYIITGRKKKKVLQRVLGGYWFYTRKKKKKKGFFNGSLDE